MEHYGIMRPYMTPYKGSDKVNSETGVLDNRRDLIKIEIFKQVED